MRMVFPRIGCCLVMVLIHLSAMNGFPVWAQPEEGTAPPSQEQKNGVSETPAGNEEKTQPSTSGEESREQSAGPEQPIKEPPTKEQQSKKSQSEENRQKEAEEAKRATELYLRNQNVFLRKGEFMVEVNSFYNRNSRQDFVPVSGGLAVAKVTTRFFDNSVIARYGVLVDGLELDVIAPLYVHAERETDFGTLKDRQTSDGVGDLVLAARYQAWYERGLRPSLVFDLDWKTRTGGQTLKGTGAYSVGGGVTVLKTLDPVVFFVRGGYLHNIARENYDLGDIFEYRFGMGFSLNDRVSFNIQMAGALIGASHIATTTTTSTPGLPGAVFVGGRRLEIMNLYFTTTVVITKDFFIEPVVGIALTNEAFTIIGIRMPFRVF